MDYYTQGYHDAYLTLTGGDGLTKEASAIRNLTSRATKAVGAAATKSKDFLKNRYRTGTAKDYVKAFDKEPPAVGIVDVVKGVKRTARNRLIRDAAIGGAAAGAAGVGIAKAKKD